MTHGITGVLRRGGRALRSVGPGTVAVAALALVTGAAGVADAANGGTFLLGKTNIASSTSVLTDTTGIPLSLDAAADKQPFSVNSTVQVNRLNAQYVGGKSAADLESSGGIGVSSPSSAIMLPVGVATTVVSTGALPAGTYYVSATALLWAGGTSTIFCRILSAPNDWGGGSGANYLQAAEISVVTVPAETILSESCTGSADGQFVSQAGIMAIRIDSSSASRSIVITGSPVAPPKS